MKITEENIAEAVRKGDEKAIRFIIDRYGGLLAAIIKRHLPHDHHDYEECLDDVLLAAWQHIDSYDPSQNSFKQWLAAIAKYKAIDYRRKRLAEKRRYLTLESPDPLAKGNSAFPERYLEHEELDDLLAPLTPLEREIFQKYYVEGTPSHEIAREYRAKPSWVHNKLSRGRKKIRQFFLAHPPSFRR